MEKCLIYRGERIKREDLRQCPQVLFAFGDNMVRQGFGGQAKEMRGEPNAVGIPTKHVPTNQSNAFFCDKDFEDVKPRIDEAFIRLADHVKAGKPVVLPKDGIGTGRADLANKAPKIMDYIERLIYRLSVLANAPVEDSQSP